ncbi:ribosome-inactivating family protein [Streptomyces sp. NBC_01310]|uniref:ribosome-inactivating family protein n=1 Tax=Streptomyces sp. NBC_01310 TaxID=2903820 RepID=UPI0035B62EE0|nr:ribosome-inactivating family protein [Streptomyces sp. NBC_01310]
MRQCNRNEPAAVEFPPESPSSELLQLTDAVVLKPVSFSVEGASVEEYRLLVSAVRARAAEASWFSRKVGSGEGRVRYLPVWIQLRGLSIELYVEFAAQNSGVRIVGFRNTFENGQAPPEVHFRHVRDSVAPPGVPRAAALPFDGGCSALEAAAGARRAALPLGRRPMINAVVWLHRNSDPKCTARGILVLSEMLCAAAGSPRMAEDVSRIWMTGGPLSTATWAAA